MNAINDNGQLITLLTMLAAQSPILIVSLIGCLMMVGWWNEGSTAAGWALAGFGLILILCVLMPVGQVLVQGWVVRGGQGIAQRAWAFTALGFLWSVLRAVGYGLLLFAILKGRATAQVNRG